MCFLHVFQLFWNLVSWLYRDSNPNFSNSQPSRLDSCPPLHWILLSHQWGLCCSGLAWVGECAVQRSVFGEDGVGDFWLKCRLYCWSWRLPQFACCFQCSLVRSHDVLCRLLWSVRSLWVGLRCVRQLGYRCKDGRYWLCCRRTVGHLWWTLLWCCLIDFLTL